jgi:N-acetylglucosaminyl-diphospho-decaprenol L-rhamnosyltransferase
MKQYNNLDCTVILPTFFPPDSILDNIKSIPDNIKVLIIDNSYDEKLYNKIKKFKNCEYFNIGDVGLSKTFNFALSKVKTKLILLTQPDVILRKNCLESLIRGINKYDNVGIAAPVVYDNGIYSKYDFYDLKYSQKNKKFNYKNLKKKINTVPSGDYGVDAVNATTMLMETEVIKSINGWDENIYLYLEDIDICLRLKIANYSIIKIADAVVDHKGWSSHFAEIKDTMNQSRVWHYTWSSAYFEKKFSNLFLFYVRFLKLLFILIVKIFFNILLFKFNKIKIYSIKISAYYAFITNRGSYFRVQHKVD